MKDKERSSDLIEHHLCHAILIGEYPIGSALPPERELAKIFGVGRPTVREALQRLGRDGWITVRKGLPALVNDYWREGNLSTLANIVQNLDSVPDDFIIYLLELRKSLTPAYIRDAVSLHRPKVVALLANLEELKDDADCYSRFDWQLQKKLANLSTNPVYLLILNSFNSFYVKMAYDYFLTEEHRKLSLQYYHQLLDAALKGDSVAAETIAKETMEKSIQLWRNREN